MLYVRLPTRQPSYRYNGIAVNLVVFTMNIVLGLQFDHIRMIPICTGAIETYVYSIFLPLALVLLGGPPTATGGNLLAVLLGDGMATPEGGPPMETGGNLLLIVLPLLLLVGDGLARPTTPFGGGLRGDKVGGPPMLLGDKLRGDSVGGPPMLLEGKLRGDNVGGPPILLGDKVGDLLAGGLFEGGPPAVGDELGVGEEMGTPCTPATYAVKA